MFKVDITSVINDNDNPLSNGTCVLINLHEVTGNPRFK